MGCESWQQVELKRPAQMLHASCRQIKCSNALTGERPLKYTTQLAIVADNTVMLNRVLPQAKASSSPALPRCTGGSWGEVPPRQGGVVIPYLASYNLVGNSTNRFGVSFGYSDCLKWGYENSIQLAAFDAVQAADILGLDLARVSQERF